MKTDTIVEDLIDRMYHLLSKQVMTTTIAVEEPANPTFLISRGPTTAVKDADGDGFKHNFDEHVDIPMFATTKRKI